MLVSICIPCYNHPKILKRCLDSLTIQTFTDYEVIISDDSDNDEIKHLLTGYKFQSLRYLKNEKALGSPENWNNALRQATGKYVKILHHDDYFTGANSLGKFVDCMEKNPGAAFCFSYTNIYFKRQDEYFLYKQTPSQLNRLRVDPEFLFFRNVIGAPSVTFFRNEPALLFNKDYKWLVDVEFYIRYLKKLKTFVSIAEPLVTIVDGEEGQITQDVSKDKKMVISEHLSLFSLLYTERLNTEKALLYFQELFVQFGIVNYDQLNKEFETPHNLEVFLKKVFTDMQKNKILKAIKKRLLTSRYNKRIFQIERF